MKKLIYSFIIVTLAIWSFTSCEDVPAPYDYPVDKKENSSVQSTTTKPQGSGTLQAPYNVAKIIEVIKTLKTGSNTPKVYVKGKVVYVTEINSQYGNATYYISDDGLQNEMLRIYRSRGLENKKFKDEKLKKGDEVIIYGEFTNHNGTPESASNKSYLYSLNGKNKMGVTPDTPDIKPGTTTGMGTEAAPYNVAAAQAKTEQSNAFVRGYIVGYVPGKLLKEAKFTADNCESETNILIADNANETNLNKCMPIQLPSGNLRSALNLKTNKNLYKQEVILYGNIEKYYEVIGLKEVRFAKVGTKTIGKAPTLSDDTSKAILEESFAKGKGNFTIFDTKLPKNFNCIWVHDSKYHYMKASAFKSKKTYEADSWLISPAINLTGNKITLTFDQKANKFNSSIDEQILIKISFNYDSGNPATAKWETLKADVMPTGKDWNTVSSTIDLSKYAGKKNARIAFQYKSSTKSAGTWEINNIVVKQQNSTK